MDLKRAITIGQFALVLGACAGTTPEVDREFLSGNEAHKGIVVFSTTHTGEFRDKLAGTLSFNCESGAKGTVKDHFAIVRFIDGGGPSGPFIGNPVVTPDRPMGRIHILELPSGSCAFTAYWASRSDMGTITTFRPPPFVIRFTVPEGGIAYIGNYNMHWRPSGGQRTFNDYYERDMAALKTQNVSLPGSVEKRVGRPADL